MEHFTSTSKVFIAFLTCVLLFKWLVAYLLLYTTPHITHDINIIAAAGLHQKPRHLYELISELAVFVFYMSHHVVLNFLVSQKLWHNAHICLHICWIDRSRSDITFFNGVWAITRQQKPELQKWSSCYCLLLQGWQNGWNSLCENFYFWSSKFRQVLPTYPWSKKICKKEFFLLSTFKKFGINNE